MSLIDADNYPVVTELYDSYTFCGLFRENSKIDCHPTKALALPATILTDYCYSYMFSDCSILNSVTCLATDISANQCTETWLSGVASSGTFYRSPDVTNGFWSGNYPSGWTIREYQP